MSGKIAVVFGGVSNENEISVVTGTMAANVLIKAGRAVLPVYISQSGEFFAGSELKDIGVFKSDGYKNSPRAIIADGGVYTLSKRRKIKAFYEIECVLNCCHGGWGEGGGLGGVCEAAKLPLASANIFGSAAFMDKYLTKILLKGLSVKCAPYELATESGADIKFEFPVIVKPVSLGSSIGVGVAKNEKQLKEALDCAFLFDRAAIVEKYFENRREINCAVYFGADGIVVSECEEAVPSGGLLTFEDKYKGGAKSVCPADIPEAIEKYIKNTTGDIARKLNLGGVARFDYIWADGEVYLSEVNTVPGSLAYYLFSKNYKDFGKILCGITDRAKEEYFKGAKKLLHTGILENISSNACKRGQKGL